MVQKIILKKNYFAVRKEWVNYSRILTNQIVAMNKYSFRG